MEASTFGATPAPRTQTPSSSALPHAFLYSDPKNTISRSTEARLQFTLAEGTYTLRDEVALGDVQPHPQDKPLQTNVLDTKPAPPTGGSRLSLAALAPHRPNFVQSKTWNVPKFKTVFGSSSTQTSQDSSQVDSENASSRSEDVGQIPYRSRFGEGNPMLAPSNAKESKDPHKRKKPKNAITKGSSSFISRGIVHENINKRLQEHQAEAIYALVNIGRVLYWLDLNSDAKHDQLMKIMFTRAHGICHDFNDLSKTPAHCDFIIGTNTADIIWFEPLSQKYAHLNKNGIIHSSAVSRICWLPGSENLFIAAHCDGVLTVHDKEKDDANFVAEEWPNTSKVSSDGKRLPRLLVKKSVQSRNQKTNPLAFWKVSNQRINDMAFSPDNQLLAVACEDGTLRTIDYHKEELIDLYRSYYGGLTCVAWSPDGEFILTGGQDDLISVWSVHDRALVARCLGHKSWVSCVAFDPWRCEGNTYRFGSVGEDGRMLLWDFSAGMLNQPRAASIRQSISSYTAAERSGSIVTMTPQMAESLAVAGREEAADELTHPILPRAAVAMLPPVMSKIIDEKHAMSWLRFEEDCILATCRLGHIYTWDRPSSGNRHSNGFAA